MAIEGVVTIFLCPPFIGSNEESRERESHYSVLFSNGHWLIQSIFNFA